VNVRDRVPRWVKRIVWDFKSSTSQPSIAPYLFVASLTERIDATSAVLDLGCGSGNLLRALRNHDWQGQYCGVDISQRAIDEARATGDPRAEWHVRAIEDFALRGQYDAICFVESIYYIRPLLVSSVLTRCLGHLTPGGGIYVRICDPKRHSDQIKIIRTLHDPRIHLFVPAI
jgi:2-polyprenyl-3-methyl-5-hydroxy-6-metoxy-1,4-benzoquinol methylase